MPRRNKNNKNNKKIPTTDIISQAEESVNFSLSATPNVRARLATPEEKILKFIVSDPLLKHILENIYRHEIYLMIKAASDFFNANTKNVPFQTSTKNFMYEIFKNTESLKVFEEDKLRLALESVLILFEHMIYGVS